MTVQVGQQIAGGKLVVAKISGIDGDGNPLVAECDVPADTDPTTQQPLVITFVPATTTAKIESLFDI